MCPNFILLRRYHDREIGAAEVMAAAGRRIRCGAWRRWHRAAGRIRWENR
jgi:hypothetical protein